MVQESYDVAIVGGGVMGCAIAYQLTKAGKKVVVVERNTMGSEASRAAAGILGAQAEIDEEGPLRAFALESRALFPAFVEELKTYTGIDVQLNQKGVIKPARSQEEAVKLKHKVMEYRDWDAEVRWLDRDQLHDLEPLASENLVGGMYLPNDGQLHAAYFAEALAVVCRNVGVHMKSYCQVYRFLLDRNAVKGVITSAGTILAEQVIVTSGAFTKHLLPDVQVYPVKGECISVCADRPLLTHTLFVDEGCYLVPKAGNRIVIGATKVAHDFSKQVTAGGILFLLEKAKSLLPTIEQTTFEDSWSGLRPQSGDGLPYMGEHPDYRGIYVASGHYRNGILLSPATGKYMADLVLGKKVPAYIHDSFRLDRKSVDMEGIK
ncbi:glycine oxidase ThiO [Polycladospora coralii]|uniref:glycine oxidase ThiO n=1 Tax=Polycladospora coralii TaxID=2771432 RepID=UPI001CD12C12|nr:glycine oxidase ThiO [Polycladospora coralii]